MKSFLLFLLILPAIVVAQDSVLHHADQLFLERDESQNLVEAVSLLKEVAEKEPQNYEILWRLSKFPYTSGDRGTEKKEKVVGFQMGIDAAKKAIAIDPGRPEAHFWLAANYGGIAEQKSMWKSLSLIKPIREEFEKVLASDPDYENGAVYQAL